MKLYSLPHACPFPWPSQPTYPIQPDPVNTSLPALYLTTLYSTSNLYTLAHHLLALRAGENETSNASLAMSLRTLVLPAHDFDKRWRYTLPIAVVPPPVGPEGEGEEDASGKGEKGRGKGSLGEEELECVRSAYERWKTAKVEGKAKVGSGDVEMEGGVEDKVGERGAARWTVQEENAGDWLRELELVETRIQVLLLLTLISLPPNPSSIPPRKKKNPERHASTLDPELLLDFLTDRLQVWSAIKSLGATTTLDAPAASKDGSTMDVPKDDDVTWWKGIVERLFSPYLPIALLTHHATKLFPTSTTLFEPPTHSPSHPTTTAGPSPFKQRQDRSLLSLDKSARKKWSTNQTMLESPTMKKLIAASSSRSRTTEKEGEREVFKVPAPRKQSVGKPLVASTSASWMDEEERAEEEAERVVDARKLAEREEAKAASGNGTVRSRPRKQERPRPLPRGDALGAGSKGLFNRREVSLGKKRVGVKVVVPVPIEKGKEKSRDAGSLSRGTKRKSVSPRKISTSEARTLVPDTPSKPLPPPVRASSFGRTPSLPSFASLGAAFRPGAPPPLDLSLGIPPAPKLASTYDEMDSEEDERGMGTPEQKKRAWIIPDT